MRKSAIAFAVAAAFAAGLLAAQFGVERAVVPVSHAVNKTETAPATAQVPVAAALPDFSALVEAQGPAVVNISVTKNIRPAGPQGAPFRGQPGDPFEEFLRRFQPPMPQGPEGDGPSPSGVGSGFIISPDGYILTNAHVVKDADEVTVKLTDRRDFTAKVVGVDSRTDVAVIKIEATDLPTVRIGDPDRVKVGNWVAAIGSPFGLESTVTAGIVSAKSRNLPSDAYVPFIQTDVAVNPGNSGGPLFNLAGEVVGINSQIYSRTGGYMGLSFAIPIDVAIKVKDDLLKFGKVQRGRIGVTIQPVNKELAGSFGLDRPRGALVSGVDKGGPADAAGLKLGDVILSVNGHGVEQSIDLPRMIGDGRPGSEAALEIWREGKVRNVTVKLGEMPAERVAQADPAPAAPTQLGLVVRPLSGQEKDRIGATGGVIVERAEGPAARAGIRPGDVILALNSESIDSPEALKGLVARSKDRVAVLVQRNNARFYVPVPLG